MDIMQSAEQFLNSAMNTYCSEAVAYLPHGAQTSVSVNAVVGKSFFATTDVSGYVMHSRTVDFIIPVSSLSAEPALGDTVTRANGEVLEVYAPNGEPCWRFSGNNHSTYRIHTHKVT